MTEWRVYEAITAALSPLRAYGFRFVRHGDDVAVDVAGEVRFIPARELINDGDPCGLVAGRFGI